MLSKKKKEEIVAILQEKISNLTCPMCANKKFNLVEDGFFSNFPQENFTSLQMGSLNIPTLAIVCEKCGFLSQHALGALGLLNETS